MATKKTKRAAWYYLQRFRPNEIVIVRTEKGKMEAVEAVIEAHGDFLFAWGPFPTLLAAQQDIHDWYRAQYSITTMGG